MLTHRVNWMGMGGVESTAVALSSLRDTADVAAGTLRNKDYQQRRRVAALIRERLHAIKTDLGLVAAPPAEEEPRDDQADDDKAPHNDDPTTNAAHDDGDHNDEDEKKECDQSTASIASSVEAPEKLAQTTVAPNDDALSLTMKLDQMQEQTYAAGVRSYIDGSIHKSFLSLQLFHASVIAEVQRRLNEQQQQQQAPQQSSDTTAAAATTTTTTTSEEAEKLASTLREVHSLENDYPLLFVPANAHTERLVQEGIVQNALTQDALNEEEAESMRRAYAVEAERLAAQFQLLPTVVEVLLAASVKQQQQEA